MKVLYLALGEALSIEELRWWGEKCLGERRSGMYAC